MHPRKRSPLKRPFVLTVGTVAAAALTACMGQVETIGNPPPLNPDDGGSDASQQPDGNPAGCPAQEPTSGTACSLANGTECDYGTGSCGGGTFATCENGGWSIIISNPPAPFCPTTPPVEFSPCYPCAGYLSCQYGTCADAGPAGPITAQCVQGTWRHMGQSCNPPAPDSGIIVGDL
jgi:hypothetical protein